MGENMVAEFKDVVDFHQHLCLDIAIGYRAGLALVREMGDELKNMKEVVAHVGNETCAVDAIQEVTGCTFGKRNIYLDHIGKPVYILQNTKSGTAVRAYCTYWETFDHTELRALRKTAKAADSSDAQKAALLKKTEETIEAVLAAPESELFSITRIKLPAPPKSGKYLAEACTDCGEQADVALLTKLEGKQLCKECVEQETVST